MKLLITGGAGFIGSNYIRHRLEANPADVIVNLDALTYAGNLTSLADVADRPNYTFVEGDIRDQSLVDRLMKDADAVIHFAAESHVDRSLESAGEFVATNVQGTLVLLEAARKHGVRFHSISTDEVFGSLALDESRKFDETSNYDPQNPYAASKAAADHLVRAYHNTYGLPVTITNCSNNFGPYQHPEKFIPRMITNLLDGQTIKVYGDGCNVRDWLHVSDHCRAIDRVLEAGRLGETYLVGGMTEDVNNLQLARQVLTLMDGDESQIKFVKDRPGHDRRYAVDWSKIHAELAWQPEHPFDDWLAYTVAWYRDNEAWWRPLKGEAESIYG